jgi:hypothetical protein
MKKLVVLGIMVAATLALATPAWADTVTAGGLIAGELEGGAVVAGSPNLAQGAPNLGFGQDAAGAGNFGSTFAIGFNVPLQFNLGIAAASPPEEVIAEDVFLD